MTLLLLQQDRSRLEQFLQASTSDPWLLATALGIAFFLGAAHALTPGHGKTIVAAYLVGSRGRLADAVYLGSVVTVTHTASVFALGLVTLYASTQVSLDRIYPWLSLLSGALVAVIGLWLLYQRSRNEGHHHHHHHHGHGHGHEHGEAHTHEHTHGHDHHHAHEQEHEHDHHHDQTGHGRPSKGSLLSLGISGGLVPCPEALVVLMLSISLRRVLFGLALLTAFSLGLAAVLIAIGCAMVMAGPAVKKISGDAPWLRKLPVVSAVVVTVLGIVMVAQATRSF